ncbi:cell division protein [Sulfolobales archaeon HS-7]|nr:cell division protein [Sulfolobales archaeon HS-7]
MTGGGRRGNLPEVITRVQAAISEQMDKLDGVKRRLEERDKELFRRLKVAHLDEDKLRASIYAQEIAELRNMIKIVYTAYLTLEKIRLRLEKAQTMQEIGMNLYSTSKAISLIVDKVKKAVPELAIGFENLNSNLNEIVANSKIPIIDTSSLSIMDQQARQIYEEASKLAEDQMKTKLQEISNTFPHVPSTEGHIQSYNPISETDVLFYITTHGNIFDIDDFCKTYNADRETVIRVLERMSKEGKIVFT